MKVALFKTEKSKDSNTERVCKALNEILDKQGFEVLEVSTNQVQSCTGCRACERLPKCVLSDADLLKSVGECEAIVFVGPVYFFSLCADLQKALERLFCIDLYNKVLGLALMTGSPYSRNGIDVIESQFAKIDDYCGCHTIPAFNKVTYDKRTPVNECDQMGLEWFVKDLYVAILDRRSSREAY